MSFIINPYVYGSPLCADADGNAFLTATGITNPTIASAICTLVTSMKANGTWAKCSAIYPFVGGTSTTHKFNLKNPADTNAAFRLSFSGGWTHSSNGIQGNGVNTFADTFLNPNGLIPLNSASMSIYSRTNLASNTAGDMGCFSTSTQFLTFLRLAANIFTVRLNTTNFNGSDVTSMDSRGMFILSRTASNIQRGFRNGSLIVNGNLASSAVPSFNIYIGAIYSVFAGLSNVSSRQYAFASIGSGLTDAEAVALNSSVQTFQTTLGRQV
jgi:hypothetical protein